MLLGNKIVFGYYYLFIRKLPPPPYCLGGISSGDSHLYGLISCQQVSPSTVPLEQAPSCLKFPPQWPASENWSHLITVSFQPVVLWLLVAVVNL